VSSPYQILARKRRGLSLGADDLAAIVSGASDGTWSEAELAAFLMAAAIRGLDQEETHRLTLAMMQSGDCWDLASDIPGVVDKHSTGGVGDKVSLVLAPLMAAARIPIIMLTGVDQMYNYRMEVDESWVACDRYLEKPVSPEKLLGEVASLIG